MTSATPARLCAAKTQQRRHGTAAAAAGAAAITPYVFFTCLMAGSGGGLMYGYDLVVAGGVSIMEDFLEMFYPSVYESEKNAKKDNYCKYNNQVFQLFTSSLYIAALLATFVGGAVTKRLGHKATMLSAGLLFIMGTLLGAGAENLEMLLLGRVLLGCGLGLSNQAVPLYLSEIAPATSRGALNMMFSLSIAVGLFAGNLVNYLASHIHPWGWRLSLAVAGIPSLLLTLFSLILVDTPTHLVRRGDPAGARDVLLKIRARGADVDAELAEIVDAYAKVLQYDEQGGFRNLLRRRNTPQVVMAVALPFFQQVSGNDAILFYGPFLFKAAGLGAQASLYSSVFTGSVALIGNVISVFLVDKAGRRRMLVASTVVMFLCMVVMAALFGVKIPAGHPTAHLTKAQSAVDLAMMCLFVTMFNGSWGPLAWVIPSEIFPLEIRSAAQSVTVCVNVLFKGLLAQTFLSMLCAFKFGMFLFFAGWLAVMGTFTLFLLPETKGIPLEKMVHVWEAHWFWGRFVAAQASAAPSDGHHTTVQLPEV